jgi:phosphohistidine phosphatase
MPLEVLVLRHAIAADRDRARWPDDERRPLTARGMRRFGKAAAGLVRLIEPPDEVWSSPLRRARQTARITAGTARWPAAQLSDALRPGVAAPALGASVEARRRRGQAPRRLAVVGHEPALSRFIAWSVGASDREPFELRKGGAALLEFAGPVRAGAARLCWLVPPRILRALRPRRR